jgi:hypothetical protein
MTETNATGLAEKAHAMTREADRGGQSMAYQNHPVCARRIDLHLAAEGMDGVREACERRAAVAGMVRVNDGG